MARLRSISAVPSELTAAERDQVRRWAERKARFALGRLLDLEEACLDHHRSTGNVKRIVDWPAAVRTWIRREAQFARPADAPRPRPALFETRADPAAKAELDRRRELHRLALVKRCYWRKV